MIPCVSPLSSCLCEPMCSFPLCSHLCQACVLPYCILSLAFPTHCAFLLDYLIARSVVLFITFFAHFHRVFIFLHSLLFVHVAHFSHSHRLPNSTFRRTLRHPFCAFSSRFCIFMFPFLVHIAHLHFPTCHLSVRFIVLCAFCAFRHITHTPLPSLSF